MQKEHIDLITRYPISIVLLEDGKTPFMDAKGRGYLFFNEEDFKKIFDENPHLKLSKAVYYQSKDINHKFYINGFLGIRIYKDGVWEDVPLDEERLYVQQQAVRDIILFKETKQKRYLLDIYNQKFLAAIKLEFSSFHYVYTSMHKNRLYILFTDIDSFNQWNSLCNKQYKAVEVTLRDVKRYAHKSGILINPIGNKLWLDRKSFVDLERESRDQ